MSSVKQYCYSCRVEHDIAQMRLIETRNGRRWRCLRSVRAASLPIEARDAFGEYQRQYNLSEARRKLDELNGPHRWTRLGL